MSRSYMLQIGQTLTVDAGQGDARVVPLTTGEPGSPVPVTATTQSFGPFDDVRLFRVTTLAGTVTVSQSVVTITDNAAFARKYNASIREGQSSGIFVPGGSTLTLTGIGFYTPYREASPTTPFSGSVTLGPFSSTRRFTVYAVTGVVAVSTAWFASVLPQPTLAALLLSSTSFATGVATDVSVIGKTAGSTLSATSSDGTTLTVNGTTLSGTFGIAGTPTITVLETLAGSPNSPRSTPINVTVVTAGGGGLAPTVSTATFSSNGVDYTLSEARPVGAYANGERFVVGPATIIGEAPASQAISGTAASGETYAGRTVHGAMLNPGIDGITYDSGAPQGFDSISSAEVPSLSSVQPYSAAVNRAASGANPPGTMTSASYVKTVSNPTFTAGSRDMQLRQDVLTVVPSVPLADAFRPHPSADSKVSLFSAADLDLSVLPKLAAPGGAAFPAAAEVAALVRGPYQTYFGNNLFARTINPSQQQRVYGRDIARDLGTTMLFCCLDMPDADKLPIVKGLVQIGLDVWQRMTKGGRWPALAASFGGGSHWEKACVVFAARVLRNSGNTSALASLVEYADTARRNLFPEDLMTVIVSRAMIETTPTPPDAGFARTQYQAYQENTPDWNSKPSDNGLAGPDWNQKYRQNVGSSSIGFVLALRLIGGEALWNSPKYFAYFDRYRNWYDNETPGNGDAIIATHKAMIDSYWPAYSPSVPAISRVVARDEYIWVEFDRLLDLARVPPSSALAVTVGGAAATVSAVIVYGYSLAVRLAAPVAEGAAVTVGYVKPGAGAARTLGGAEVATTAPIAAANLTGALPSPATVKALVRNGTTATPATRQYSKAAAPQSAAGAIQKLLIGQRFRLLTRTSGDTILSSGTGSSTGYRSYLPTVTDHRILILGQQMRLPGFWSVADDGASVTLWTAFDWTKTTAADVMRASKNGANIANMTGSTPDVTGTATYNPATLFSAGIGLFGIPTITPNGGTNVADMAHEWTWIDYGTSSMALPADLSAAQFGPTFDPGGNGQAVTGAAPRYFWAGALDEYNSGGPINRGRGPVASMAAQRTFVQDGDTIPYPFSS